MGSRPITEDQQQKGGKSLPFVVGAGIHNGLVFVLRIIQPLHCWPTDKTDLRP